ncbi:hypothetical protein EB118_18120, partial [bacterium]|nr:hypothetical protein [bacterium]
MFNTFFETIDSTDQLSIKYTNLYYLDNQFWYFTTDPKEKPPYVNKWTNTYGWRPNIKIFDSQSNIQTFLTYNYPNIESISLGLLSDNLWYGNVGHALFDGLYPVYLASVKFGYDDSPFVYLTNDWTNNKVTADEAIRLFSKTKQILNYPKIDRNIIFNTLICGTGNTGNRVISKQYTLYGKKYDAIYKFKKRIMQTCGAEHDRLINSPIQGIIVHNKRYSVEEQKIIDNVIEYFN